MLNSVPDEGFGGIYFSNVRPVMRSYAWMYFSLVFSITSCGRRGGLPVRSQFSFSQLRTNCLSKLGCS